MSNDATFVLGTPTDLELVAEFPASQRLSFEPLHNESSRLYRAGDRFVIGFDNPPFHVQKQALPVTKTLGGREWRLAGTPGVILDAELARRWVREKIAAAFQDSPRQWGADG